ncbi:protein translocase subunit SecD [Sphingomonas lenta]|uniref:Protein translocase subunit SecD n=1 Tax=Sphingomonas lenta TaxID=1141887 RepID=A0A2A2SG66_9SPHN|nr:protein translocase subunit SecD [Sphingomonas lenta]PAX08256.1 protein translocase subunit SecD [Sphingomonas lenta]
MLDMPRWKTLLTWGVVAILCLLAVPSLTPDRYLPNWAERLPRVNLGLDLAGGSYLLLEADTAALQGTRLEALRDQIQTEMRRQRPRIEIGDISTRGGQVSFMLRDPSQVDAARERLLGITGGGAGFTGQREYDIQVVDQSRFVITPTSAGLAQAVDTAMSDATEVVRRRIDELGTREPSILRQGANRIVVQVPGLQDPEALKALLGRTARLEFKLVDLNATPDQLARGQAPVGSQILPSAEGAGPVAVKRSAILTGDRLIDARQAFNPQTNEPEVVINFDNEGGRRFARVTTANVGKPFAIIVDNQVISAPSIREPITTGTASISGSFTVESANQLAIALRSGKLPVDLRVIEERTVGPDLGADSIRAGIIACVVATALVMGFIIVTYGGFGLFACAALVLNVLMIVALMALFNSTLTLPGLAGFVLTVGAAVDANVLINERIREEQRRGRKLLDAISHGFTEASTAIFDANVTNVIAGALLFWFGSGPLRGFAVVLMIGIVTSYFTSVTVVRAMVARWFRRTRPRELVL